MLTTPTAQPAIATGPVTAVAILRTLRSAGIEPDGISTTRNGDFSVKFASGQSRYWANRLANALPDAQIVGRGDGAEISVVLVRV